MRKKEKGQRAEEIPLPGAKRWKTHGFETCRMYKVSKKYPIKALRGAMVQVIGPDHWKKNGRQNGKFWDANNAKLKVQIQFLKNKSKKWEPAKFKDKDIGNGAIKVVVKNRKRCQFNIKPKHLIGKD